jgi:hypothetical protein
MILLIHRRAKDGQLWLALHIGFCVLVATTAGRCSLMEATHCCGFA